MKYLVVQEWENTKGNHAGMSHMCDMLVDLYPDKYIKITKSCPPVLPQRNKFMTRIMRTFDYSRWMKAWVRDYMDICEPMFKSFHQGDEVFLLEYNWKGASQYELAKYIRTNYPFVKIRTLSHITPTLLKRNNASKYVKKWCSIVDSVLTMGSGLSDYFLEVGVPKEKLSTGFHYVDNIYYHIDAKKIQEKTHHTIIVMGALQRDFKLLAQIVNSLSDINWIICKGRKDVSEFFRTTPNVRLVSYVEEEALRAFMAQSDISLNVLEDTVGSNVITTSMAMGLAMIVSDVGSIRDYLDSTNTIFCENKVESFVSAIKELVSNPKRLVAMRKHSLDKVNNLTIDKVHDWFDCLNHTDV